MENTTPFDLNEAIRRWQQNLSASPALSAENHEELETHLRASVQRLKTTGLSEEEAFLIATRRLGDHGLLEQEFAKVNSGTIWLTRAIWMVVGILTARICASLAGAAACVALLCTRNVLASGTAGGVLAAMSYLIAEGLLIVMLCRWAIHRQKPLAQRFQRGLNSPGLSMLGLILTMIAIAASQFLFVCQIARYMTPKLFHAQTLWCGYLNQATYLILLPIALIVLARLRQKRLATTAFSR